VRGGCGNPDCGASTGICGRETFGSGHLDWYGYWSKPCRACAEAWEREGRGEAWPPAETSAVTEPKEIPDA